VRKHFQQNAVAYIALFFALTSTAWAAGLKPNSVKTKAIKNLAVTGAKLAPSAVTGDKIASDAITTDKLAAGAVTSDKIASDAITTDKLAAGAVTSADLAPPAPWQDIPFATGWSNYGGLSAVQCYQDAVGVVHLRGGARRGASATATVGTLPAACQAINAQEVVLSQLNTAGFGVDTSIALIGLNGDIEIDAGLPVLNGGVAFDGISFRPTN
jgi:hypothetical protein